MHLLCAINSDLNVLIVCNKTGGTIIGDIKKNSELVTAFAVRGKVHIDLTLQPKSKFYVTLSSRNKTPSATLHGLLNYEHCNIVNR